MGSDPSAKQRHNNIPVRDYGDAHSEQRSGFGINGIDINTENQTLNDDELDTRRQNSNKAAQDAFASDLFSMKNLKKPAAKAIMDDEEDEFEDMPFMAKKKKSTPANARPGHNDSLVPKDAQKYSDRQVVEGASKLSYYSKNQNMEVENDTDRISAAQAPQVPKVTNMYSMERLEHNVRGSQEQIPPSKQVIAAPETKKEDWFLDPATLYMRGMAQRRE